MWPSWVSSAMYCAFCLIVAGVPPLFFDASNQKTYVTIAVPLFTVCSAFVHYGFFGKPLARLRRILSTTMKSHCLCEEFQRKTLFAAVGKLTPLNEAKRQQGLSRGPKASRDHALRSQQRVLDEMDVGSYHSDLFRIQAFMKDLAQSLLQIQQSLYNHQLDQPSLHVHAPTPKNIELPANQIHTFGESHYLTIPLSTSMPPLIQKRQSRAQSATNEISIAIPTEVEFDELDWKSIGTSPPDRSEGLASPCEVLLSPSPTQSTTTRTTADAHTVLSSLPDWKIATMTRGSRFVGDNANICFYIVRSKNANLVVYEAVMEDRQAADPVLKQKPLDGYWLQLDPENIKKNREKGKKNDRSEITFFQSSLAYGFSASKDKKNAGQFVVNFTALSSRPMQLLVRDVPIRNSHLQPLSEAVIMKIPILIVNINDTRAVVERVYVATDESGVIPKVLYIDLFGYSLQTGEFIQEHIVP